jgi:hypothetical protein
MKKFFSLKYCTWEAVARFLDKPMKPEAAETSTTTDALHPEKKLPNSDRATSNT